MSCPAIEGPQYSRTRQRGYIKLLITSRGNPSCLQIALRQFHQRKDHRILIVHNFSFILHKTIWAFAVNKSRQCATALEPLPIPGSVYNLATGKITPPSPSTDGGIEDLPVQKLLSLILTQHMRDEFGLYDFITR